MKHALQHTLTRLSAGALALGLSTVAATAQADSQHQVSNDAAALRTVVAKELLYGAADQRSAGYKWGASAAAAAPEATAAQGPEPVQYAYKWNKPAAQPLNATEGLAGSSTYSESLYKWGLRSDAEQSLYKWGLRSDAEQSLYKWGLRSDAEQSLYKWGLR
jgi:hypothetical protein